MSKLVTVAEEELERFLKTAYREGWFDSGSRHTYEVSQYENSFTKERLNKLLKGE